MNTTDRQVATPTAQVAPPTLADAGATAAAMLDPAELERIYRTFYRTADGEFAYGFRSYRMRQHEGAR